MADQSADLFSCLPAEPPVNPSVLQDSEKAWTIRAATWPLNISRWLTDCDVNGWYGRTSPESCQLTKDGRLAPSSGHWSNSGMGMLTEHWTLSTLEFHSGAVASSLSHILETGDVPPQYFLSGTACRGILRRAEKRGKSLPTHLQTALIAGAQTAKAKDSSPRHSPEAHKQLEGGKRMTKTSSPIRSPATTPATTTTTTHTS